MVLVRLADDVARDHMILSAACGNLARAQYGSEPSGLLPGPALPDAIEQTGSVCITATGGINQRAGGDNGNRQHILAGVDARAFRAERNDHRLDTLRDRFDR